MEIGCVYTHPAGMLPSPTIDRRVSGRNLEKLIRTEFRDGSSRTNKKSPRLHTAEKMHKNQKMDLDGHG
jgi:hypothetical protein